MSALDLLSAELEHGDGVTGRAVERGRRLCLKRDCLPIATCARVDFTSKQAEMREEAGAIGFLQSANRQVLDHSIDQLLLLPEISVMKKESWIAPLVTREWRGRRVGKCLNRISQQQPQLHTHTYTVLFHALFRQQIRPPLQYQLNECYTLECLPPFPLIFLVSAGSSSTSDSALSFFPLVAHFATWLLDWGFNRKEQELHTSLVTS